MLERFYQKARRSLRRFSPFLHDLFFKHRTVVKYVLAGGTAAFVDLALLYFFTHTLGIWYLISAILAFVIAFGVSFTLQKFWTFRDRSREKMHRQASFYFAVQIGNLFLNTGLIYFFVEFFRIHYLLAQVIAGLLIAVSSFFIYRRFIFKKTVVL